MLLQPFRQSVQVGREGVCAVVMAAAEIFIEIFVNINGKVVGGVIELVHVIG